MKQKYYVITLNSLNKLESHCIGEQTNEDVALSTANSFGRKNKLSIIWTCNESDFIELKNSIINILT